MTTKTTTVATASIDLGNMKVEVTATLDECGDVESRLYLPMYFVDKTQYSLASTWTTKSEFIGDEEALEKFAWDEVMSIIQKYNYASISTQEVEVEDEEASTCEGCGVNDATDAILFADTSGIGPAHEQYLYVCSDCKTKYQK